MKIVTAISNSDQEAQLITLLSKQGFLLAYRALTPSSLKDYLKKTDEPLVIVFTNNFGNKSEFLEGLNINKKHKYIKWDPKLNPLSILKQVSNIEQNYPASEITRYQGLIAVFGSPGAPGVSTITDYLSIHLSAKVIYSTHHNLRPQDLKNTLSISPDNLVINLKNNILNKVIIDAGSTVNLFGTISDRRVGAKWIREVIGSCSKLIYLIRSDVCGLRYLESFVRDTKNLLDPPELIYVLNQQRFTKDGQGIQIEFKRVIQDSKFFILPYAAKLPPIESIQPSKIPLLGAAGLQKQIAKMASELL